MQPNTLLDAILDEAGISHAGLAAHVNQAGRARGLALRYEHTAVARWLKGQRPRGQVPDLICEVLAGRLHRPVTLDDIGLGLPGEPSAPHATSLSGFVERATALWRSDEQQRPHILGAPAVTGTPAVMPVWEWENPPEDVDVSAAAASRSAWPTSRCSGRRGPTTSRCTARPGASRPARGSSASSTPRRRPCCAAVTPTPPAANSTAPPVGWWPSRASAPTTPTRTASPSATSTRRCAWPRPAGTGDSAPT